MRRRCSGIRRKIAGSEETVIRNFSIFSGCLWHANLENHFPEALVGTADSLDPVLVTAPKDRHVLATALRASHAKPWALCQSDSARLNVSNSLVLAAHLDTVEQSQLLPLRTPWPRTKKIDIP
jgi:hypothetical protein